MLFLFSLFKDCFRRKEKTEYNVKNLHQIFEDTEAEERFYRQYARTYAFRKNRQVPNIDTEIRKYEPLR